MDQCTLYVQSFRSLFEKDIVTGKRPREDGEGENRPAKRGRNDLPTGTGITVVDEHVLNDNQRRSTQPAPHLAWKPVLVDHDVSVESSPENSNEDHYAEPGLLYCGQFHVQCDLTNTVDIRSFCDVIGNSAVATRPREVQIEFQKTGWDSAEMLVRSRNAVLIRKHIHVPRPNGRGQEIGSLISALARCCEHNLCIVRSSLEIHNPEPSRIRINTNIKIYQPPSGIEAAYDAAIDRKKGNICPEMYYLFLHLYPPKPSPETGVLLSHLVPSSYPTPDQRPCLQPSDLLPHLLPYQRRAVGWMLDREGMAFDMEGRVVPRMEQLDGRVPVLYEHIITDLSIKFYVNRLTGSVSVELPVGQDNEREVLGGILAEEMGLGKTVILLALILLHRSPDGHPPIDQSIDNKDRVDKGLCGACNQDGWKSHRKGADIISCEQCESWFHLKCVDMTQEDMDAAGPDYAYACPSCALTTGFSPPLSSSGTLVIAPSSIVEQWSNEAATHAPSLSVVVFTGMEKTPVTARQMTRFDMVITSYDTIRKELHAAKPEPGRSRRQGRRYERRRSPLVGVTFWRVVLDEAQMVESSVSHAAAMACMIPRVHPWAVTGTPIAKKGLADLHGLIKFLRLEPLASYPAIWQRLQEPINRGLFYDTLRRFMHRNTKANVSTELTIPAQHARTLHLDFSKVERTWYDQLYDEMIAEVRATPKRASDGAEDVRASTMSLWLLQLRQTCCHPQVGTHNRRVLGGVLRSIGEVLDLMYRQAKTAVSGTERQFCLARIHRAQMLEFIAKNKEWQDGGDAPLEVYRAVRADLQRSITAVSKQRAEILQKQKLVYVPSVADPRESQERNLLEDDEQEMEHIGNQDTISELNEELTALTARLRNLQELEHRVIYFTASVYHSCKSEELENQFYREAELIRRQLLGPEQEAACKLIDLYKSYAQKVEQKAILKVDMISDCVLPLSGGFMRDLSKSLRDIAQQLDDQWKVLCSWRDVIVKKLTCPIKTEDATDPERKIEQETDGVTVSGKDEATVETVEEYQEGIEMQAIVDVYQACYRLMLADRKQLLTGIRAEDRRLEVVTEAKEEKELRLVLEKKRRSFILTPGSLPLRELIGELQKAKNRHLPELEKRLLLNAAHTLPKVLERELARHKMLESETRAISKVFNSRLSYYMNLQRVSDGVVPAVEPADIDADIAETVSNESEMQRALVAQVARVRYLENMTREERGSDDDGTTEGAAERQKEWECLICKSPVVEGLITPCGHVYCTDCVTGWINRHKKCPLCNQPLWIKQCKPVSMRQTKRSLPVMSSQPSSSSSPSSPSSEQEQASQILLGHLANIPLLGSYGTKLDTLITHIKYLRMLDPKSKSLVFSQWEQVLDYLGQGLAKNNVQFVKLNQGRAALKGQSAVKRFREDDNVQVIMLNARSQSAGLTLVGANNVFLIEPVVNLALEAQAINRVHRIGQTRETTVWRYIIRDSIEERVAALGQRSRASFNGCSEGDAVNESSKPGLETRAGGGGERVEQSDVRWCLFGDLSPPECTAPSSPAPSAAAPSLSPSPLQPSSPIPQSSTASPRRSLSPPPVLDDSANAFLVTLERRLAAVGDSQDEEGGGVHPPYTSRRGRGMAGKRRYIS